MPTLLTRCSLTLSLILATGALAAGAPTKRLTGVTQVRIDPAYAAVAYADGHRSLFPLGSLTEAERAWLTETAAAHPLAHGNSTVTTSHVQAKAKITIARQSRTGTAEEVQLCPPNVIRDQIGGTCALYAQVHLLDIAGYPVDQTAIYRVIDKSPPENPWLDPGYAVRLEKFAHDSVPARSIHERGPTDTDAYEWARQQIRLGRPMLAHMSRELWLTLPADFLATHPWDGNNQVGHAVVINGFVWDPAAPQHGTFHVVNSWRDLAEFDVPVDQATKRALFFVASLSPKGEVPPPATKITISSLTQLQPVGKQFLYSAETNVGRRRVVAADEESARHMIEDSDHP